MEIKRATIDDFPALTLLDAELQAVHVEGKPERFIPDGIFPREVYEEIFAAHAQGILLCVDHDEIVGYLHYEIKDEPANHILRAQRHLYIHALAVKSEHQRKGYGEALMAEAEKIAKANDVPRITLIVWAFNQSATAFYQKLGYAPLTIRMERLVN